MIEDDEDDVVLPPIDIRRLSRSPSARFEDMEEVDLGDGHVEAASHLGGMRAERITSTTSDIEETPGIGGMVARIMAPGSKLDFLRLTCCMLE